RNVRFREASENGGKLNSHSTVQNFFSQLPRDCNLSVFRLVNRRTLNELEFVSKEVAHIVSDPSLSRLKTRGSLYIKELPDGSRNFQFCSRYPYRICYDIEQGKDEGTRSMRDNSSFRAPACARRFYPETFVPHPIPSHMLDSLADLGKTHGFNAIALHGVSYKRHLSFNFVVQF
ncbi:hypothetical protein PRIPAC_86657, partial [Pristionchus pacificus]